jgi:CRISPR/Cas system-associated endonuclease Cas1
MLKPTGEMMTATPSSFNPDLAQADLSALLNQAASRLEMDPDAPENGLAKLVLAVIELLRQLCERQAIRRMESGSLDDEEIEKLGEAFMRLEAKMKLMKELFGLEGEDLNLDLGPLGKLL